MCGLAGVAGNLYYNHNNLFRDLMLVTSLRGVDSTGIAYVDNKEGSEPVIMKGLGLLSSVYNNPLYEKSFDARGKINFGKKVLMGHCRAATMGDISVESAHPFEFGNIVGMHNGTLTYWHDLEDYKTEDLDSRALIKTIAKRGIEDAWGSFNGAAALVFWDKKEETLNFIRNDERPLYIVATEKNDAILWASEYWMLQILPNRADLKLLHEIGEDKKPKLTPHIISLKPHHLHVFKPESTSCRLINVKELKPRRTVYGFRNSGFSEMYGDDGFLFGHGYGQRASARFKAVERKIPGNKPELTRPEKIKDNLIDLNWAKGLEKADKDFVGKKFFITNEQYIVGKGVFFSGYLEEHPHIRVEVYPRLPVEIAEFRNHMGKGFQRKYKIARRPRVLRSETTKNILTVRIQATYVEPEDTLLLDNLVKTFRIGKNLVSEAFFRKHLLDVTKDNCCSYCGNPIDINDSDYLEWIGNTGCLCPVCKEDPEVRLYLQQAM